MNNSTLDTLRKWWMVVIDLCSHKEIREGVQSRVYDLIWEIYDVSSSLISWDEWVKSEFLYSSSEYDWRVILNWDGGLKIGIKGRENDVHLKPWVVAFIPNQEGVYLEKVDNKDSKYSEWYYKI